MSLPVERCGGGERLRVDERVVGFFEEHDPFAQDVHEEVAAELQLRVHVVEAMDDQADRRAQPTSGGQFG